MESDLAYRFEYVSQFMGFSEEDIQAIHAAAEHLALTPFIYLEIWIMTSP